MGQALNGQPGQKGLAANSTSIITEVNDPKCGVFGRNRYDPPRIKKILNDFFNNYKAGNFDYVVKSRKTNKLSLR